MSPASRACRSRASPGKTWLRTMPSASGGQVDELAIDKSVPQQSLLERDPDEVFLDAVRAIQVPLVMQVVAGTARRDFGDQLRCTVEVTIVVDSTAAARFGKNQECRIRLRIVLGPQLDRRVVGDGDSGRAGLVAAQPGHQTSVRISMLSKTDSSLHVDSSPNAFRLLQVRHRLLTLAKLLPRESVPVLEGRRCRINRTQRPARPTGRIEVDDAVDPLCVIQAGRRLQPATEFLARNAIAMLQRWDDLRSRVRVA